MANQIVGNAPQLESGYTFEEWTEVLEAWFTLNDINAEEKKKQALQNKEGIVIDQMDAVAGENETLTKYVNKVKLEVRMKANDATLKLADDEMARILTKIQKKDAKEVKTLDKELAQAA